MSEIKPEDFTQANSIFNEVFSLKSEIELLFSGIISLAELLNKAARLHGGQLHKASWQCSECAKEKRDWLESKFPNWRELAKEKGCCSLCIQRAYELLKDK